MFRVVEWKKPCVRVQYIEQGYPKFHIDFAIYSEKPNGYQTYLAKGTPTSQSRSWEESDPRLLVKKITNKYSDPNEQHQFLRVIRYLKRWRDIQFNSVHGKPTGIALTALAYQYFQPFTKESFTGKTKIEDIQALLNLVKRILDRFNWFFNRRISVNLPVPPGNDLFEKMTENQCEVFHTKLTELKDTIERALAEVDPIRSCEILQKKLGVDFWVPSRQATAQPRPKAIVGTSESA